MQKLLLILIIALFSSCEKIIEDGKKTNDNAKVAYYIEVLNTDDYMMKLPVYIIDSCEYIGNITGYREDYLTHKGNCKNPIHYK